jgi:hypothetical protein
VTQPAQEGAAIHGLSCYTAALHDYLAQEWDGGAVIGSTIRLAVRVDLPDGQLAFSHHQPSLDRLPDGSWLRYASASCAAAALPTLAQELDAHGRAIAVVDSSLLPWSAAQGGQPAPHWLLLDDREGSRWHVTDSFTALLPNGGEQQPYQGWLDVSKLTGLMELPACWTQEQHARNTLAFGAPVAVPGGGSMWLRRCQEGPPPAAQEGRWLTAVDEVLRYLAGYLAERGAGGDRYLDDLWAAAGHHAFAYRWRLRQRPDGDALRVALDRWRDLPRLLRLATLSAQRGRPRPTLIRAALDELARAEAELT